jgi:hypothetical protein
LSSKTPNLVSFFRLIKSFNGEIGKLSSMYKHNMTWLVMVMSLTVGMFCDSSVLNNVQNLPVGIEENTEDLFDRPRLWYLTLHHAINYSHRDCV